VIARGRGMGRSRESVGCGWCLWRLIVLLCVLFRCETVCVFRSSVLLVRGVAVLPICVVELLRLVRWVWRLRLWCARFGAQRHPVRARNVVHDGGCYAATGAPAAVAPFSQKTMMVC
jgi:hypothetical protein